jgi:O-antigen/teichoic acid export membrane protein
MGTLLEKITRYNTITLLLTGLPLIVLAFPILRIWVGPDYASHTIPYLRILVVANVVRNLCAPYATMVTATATQKSVIAAAVSEAVVNLACSLYLGWRFGAIGVAIGTLVGAFVSVFVHFGVSMRLSRAVISISRAQLLFRGILAPCMLALPSLLLLPHWWSARNLHLISSLSMAWLFCTVAPTYYCLNRQERHSFRRLVRPWRSHYFNSLFSVCC